MKYLHKIVITNNNNYPFSDDLDNAILSHIPVFDNYNIRFWNDQNAQKFILENFDEKVLKAYLTVKAGAFKKDLFSYCLMYKLGGWFFDWKFKIFPEFRNYLEMLESHDIVFMDSQKSNERKEIWNAMFYSKPNLIFWKDTIDEIVDLLLKNNYSHTLINPQLIYRMYHKYKSEYKYYNLKTVEVNYYGDGYINDTKIFQSKVTGKNWVELNGNCYNALWSNRKLYDDNITMQITKTKKINVNDLDDVIDGINNIIIKSPGGVQSMAGNCMYHHFREGFHLRPEAWELRANLMYYGAKCEKIMEIGTNAGHTLAHFLCNDIDHEIYVFDINEHKYHEPCMKYLNEKFNNCIQLFHGDSWKTVRNTNLNVKMDLIHVDGNHTVEYCMSDILKSRKFATDKTILIVDDTNDVYLTQLCNKLVGYKYLIELRPPTPSPFHRIFKYNFCYDKVHVSLTTIPERVDNLCETLDSIEKSLYPFDSIIINIPKKCLRSEKEYNLNKIRDYAKKYKNLKINHIQEDLGALSKIVPTLDIVGENDLLVVIDDDRNYKDNHISNLVFNYCENENCCITNTAYKHDDVEIIMGCFGYLLKKEMLKYNNWEKIVENEIRNVDDYVISNILKLNKIKILNINQIEPIRNKNDTINDLYTNTKRDHLNNLAILFFKSL